MRAEASVTSSTERTPWLWTVDHIVEALRRSAVGVSTLVRKR
jgi:hypothetical protein